jgi:ribosomal protein S18 acetylase RimI-like enzyme
MDVVVARTPDGWTAHDGELAVGSAAASVRPDGRCFVFFRSCHAEAYRPLVQAIARHVRRDLYTEIDEADAEVLGRLADLGFVVNRREHAYAIPTDPAITGLAEAALPAGFVIVAADQVSEDRLRELDDELRRDVPGCDGWRWTREGFRSQTYDAPDFDPATYLVAVEQATGRYAGLVRVWIRPSGPRLGLIAVGRPYRRRGLASVLLARAFGVLQRRGESEVVAEVDVANTSSTRLLTRLGARRTGGSMELVRLVGHPE